MLVMLIPMKVEPNYSIQHKRKFLDIGLQPQMQACILDQKTEWSLQPREVGMLGKQFSITILEKDKPMEMNIGGKHDSNTKDGLHKPITLKMMEETTVILIT